MQEETASASQKSVGQMPGAEGGQPSKQTYWPKKGRKLSLPRKRKHVKAVAGGV